jgi:hypothetical protein
MVRSHNHDRLFFASRGRTPLRSIANLFGDIPVGTRHTTRHQFRTLVERVGW